MRIASRGAGAAGGASNPGQNPPSGVIVRFHLATAGQPVKLEFVAPDGAVIKSYESADSAALAAERAAAQNAPMGGRGGAGAVQRPANAAGMNTFTWDMRYPDASAFRGMIMWAGSVRGPIAPAGTYSVRMTVGNAAPQVATFKLLNDPRTTATDADLLAQFQFLMKIRDKTTEANDAVKQVRWVRGEMEDRLTTAPQLRSMATGVDSAMSRIEREVYQVKNQSGQDPLNFPVRLNNRIAALNGVVASGPYGPTAQSQQVFAELSVALGVQLTQLKQVFDTDLKRLNDELQKVGLAPIVPKAEEKPLTRPAPVMDDDLFDETTLR